MSDKTEQPTPRRLRKAREQGDSGASTFATQAVAFLVAVALAPSAGRAAASRVVLELRAVMARGSPAMADVARVDVLGLGREIVSLVVPLFAATAIAACVVHGIQTGGVVAFARLAPDLARLDPIAGVRGLFSPVRLFAVVRAFVGSGIVLVLAYAALRTDVAAWAHLAGGPSRIARVGPAAAQAAANLAMRVALLGLLLGVVDLLVTRRSWLRRLRMTKEEVKREHRDAEGDPQTKAARERAHHEVLAQTTIAEVRNATVVVVNPTHLACALRYDRGASDEAPVIVAKGEGEAAARIAEAARLWGVPVVEDVPLARALVALETGTAIPEALYEAVAEILRAILDGEAAAGEGRA